MFLTELRADQKIPEFCTNLRAGPKRRGGSGSTPKEAYRSIKWVVPIIYITELKGARNFTNLQPACTPQEQMVFIQYKEAVSCSWTYLSGLWNVAVHPCTVIVPFPAQIWERQYQGLSFPSDSEQSFSSFLKQRCLSSNLGGDSNYQAAKTEQTSSFPFLLTVLSLSLENLAFPWH